MGLFEFSSFYTMFSGASTLLVPRVWLGACWASWLRPSCPGHLGGPMGLAGGQGPAADAHLPLPVRVSRELLQDEWRHWTLGGKSREPWALPPCRSSS